MFAFCREKVRHVHLKTGAINSTKGCSSILFAKSPWDGNKSMAPQLITEMVHLKGQRAVARVSNTQHYKNNPNVLICQLSEH